ncbi:MAG: hypothetical protein IJ335_05660 [Lachnospiraceae bacterium]|nr:hypothetical protein [Lachnospiraceae bacterium]
MERFKKVLWRLLFPPLILALLLIPMAGALVVYILASGQTDTPLAYVSYGLSAYALVILCVRLPRWMKGFGRLKRENKYVHRYLTDVQWRMKLSLYLSLAINILYALLQLGTGFYFHSVWFYALSGYYALLAFMRFFLLKDVRHTQLGAQRMEELGRYRFCGMVLVVLNLVLAVIVAYIVWLNRGFSHHEILTIAMAAYTFWAMAMAVKNIIQYRKYNSPVMSAAKAISLTAALVSLLSLESAMLNAWGNGDNSLFRQIMTGATGAVVCLVVHVLAIYMIVHATKEIKDMKKGFLSNE